MNNFSIQISLKKYEEIVRGSLKDVLLHNK